MQLKKKAAAAAATQDVVIKPLWKIAGLPYVENRPLSFPENEHIIFTTNVSWLLSEGTELASDGDCKHGRLLLNA